MPRRFDDIYEFAAGDGASAPILYDSALPQSDAEDEDQELLDAWYRECTQKIESTLLLEEARKLLCTLIAEQKLGPKRRKQVERLVRNIKGLKDSASSPSQDS